MMKKSNRAGKKDKKARMDAEHVFQFNCAPDVPCFTKCCQDITIVLTPYDVLRLKNALKIPSFEFLDRYTVIIPKEKRLIPMVVLKMNENDKCCPFVSEKGCAVYTDRPWPCRMYPLGLASPKDGSPVLEDELYFLLREDVCKGFNEDKSQTVEEWLDSQGINEYNEMGTYFKELTLVGSRGMTPNDFISAIDVVQSGRLELAPFVTHRFTLDQTKEALDLVNDRGADALRVVVCT